MPKPARAPRGNLIAAAEDLLIGARQLDETASSVRLRAVAGARAAGMSWDDIAARLGTTARAARAAYERAVER